VANRPSSIPSGGRLLDRAEQEALEREMEAIVVRSHLFKSLDDAGRQELLESGFVMRFDAGDVVMSEGAQGDTMYLVMEGTVRVETRGPTGTIQLAELGRGACVGEVSVLTGGPRTATVTAITPVVAVTFARHRIQRILDAHPKVRAILEAMIEGRARDTVGKILGA
jgi:CRP/FNR family cyclic AMP-dependent transcriptional regulator